MIKIPILIPAYNPDQRLVQLVESLIRVGTVHIVIVNDGSHEKSDTVFQQLEKLEPCTLLTHAVNSGKGRALKTGLNHIFLQFPNSTGVVTADCDGQHRPEDILAVARALTQNPDQLIMGVRKMGNKVPFRSLFGNVCTRFIFSFVIGKKVSDTQSGLRGLPLSFIPHLLKTKGEGYEFEINMLILTKLRAIKIHEVVIDTIYIEDNKSSHFNPLLDSMKIYFQLFRFAFSSLLASFFDFIIFSLMFKLTSSIIVSLLIGRFLVGSLLNYVLNRRLVFHSNARVLWSLIKYYIALIVMSLLSYLLIHFTMEQLGLKVMLAKILVETLLFALSFSLQREFVFTAKEED
jgi:glycosyltransferase involved in cell wall biosynthesis